MSRTRRRVLAAAVSGISLLTGGREVRRLRAVCVALSVCYEFEYRSIVVLAEVIEASSGLEVVGNQARFVPQVVRLRVIERFKGIPEDQREITARIDTTGETPNRVALGRHLIYANASD